MAANVDKPATKGTRHLCWMMQFLLGLKKQQWGFVN